MQAKLDALARSLAGSFAFAGVAVAHGRQEVCATACAPGISGDAASLFRIASPSKIVVGHVMQALVAPPYDQAIGIRDRVVTLGMLASHSAGLGDAMVPADGSLVQFLSKTDLRIAEPGAEWHYSNIGYVILAAALEQIADQPFDALAAQVLSKFGINGGFNWSGVLPADRARALPTYRRDGDGFVAQIDANVPARGLMQANGSVIDMAHYTPGWNPAVSAPHAGLRTHLPGMLALAKSVKDITPDPLWRLSDGPGDYLDGLCQDYGLGVQILPNPPFYPRPLIGHFGSAYGLKSGVWHDAKANISFAYALNGAALGDESDLLTPDEDHVFDVVAGLP